jgi:hypothetical protein
LKSSKLTKKIDPQTSPPSSSSETPKKSKRGRKKKRQLIQDDIDDAEDLPPKKSSSFSTATPTDAITTTSTAATFAAAAPTTAAAENCVSILTAAARVTQAGTSAAITPSSESFTSGPITRVAGDGVAETASLYPEPSAAAPKPFRPNHIPAQLVSNLLNVSPTLRENKLECFDFFVGSFLG